MVELLISEPTHKQIYLYKYISLNIVKMTNTEINRIN